LPEQKVLKSDDDGRISKLPRSPGSIGVSSIDSRRYRQLPLAVGSWRSIENS
jgi:hypothetical protein